MTHAARMERVCQWIKTQNFDVLLIDNPVDLFYLTGLNLSLGRLFMSLERSVLFVDGRYIEAAKKQSCCEVHLSQPESLRSALEQKKIIGFDSAFMTVAGWESLQKQILGKQWLPIEKPLKKFRAIKEEGEINSLRKAAKLTWAGFEEIRSHLQEGISEEELALEFEIFCKKRGASALSFPPIIAFGENSASPHHRAGKSKLQKNQIVLIDVGAVVDEYRGDMTRTLFFGTPDPKLHDFFVAVKQAQSMAVAAIRPGILFGEIDRIARGHLHKSGIDSLFIHGLSHGIGLETHEYPSLKIQGGDSHLLLEPGMVFTVEPGVYLPGLGGVRIEDTVRVTKTGVENFFDDQF